MDTPMPGSPAGRCTQYLSRQRSTGRCQTAGQRSGLGIGLRQGEQNDDRRTQRRQVTMPDRSASAECLA